ncbi:DUF397 domain-containing protein [Actinoallomurus acanthiterrae]
MKAANRSYLVWRKSSHSGMESGSDCVEVARLDESSAANPE